MAFARREKTDEEFRAEMLEAVQKYSRTQPIDMDLWKRFSEKIIYHRSDFHENEGYESLKALLEKLDTDVGTAGNRVFYLSTQPSFFPLVTEKLKEHRSNLRLTIMSRINGPGLSSKSLLGTISNQPLNCKNI